MRNGNRSLWHRIIYSPIGIIIGCIGLFIFVRAGWSIHEKADLAQQRLDQAQSQLSDLQDEKSRLSSSIAYLSTPAGIEATLRDKYHGVKEGESVAVILGGPDDSTSSNLVSSTTPTTSWWGRFLDFLGL